jgi:hypothetical protein
MMGESKQTTFDSQAEPGFRETAELGELSDLGVRTQVELKTRQLTRLIGCRCSQATWQPGASRRHVEGEVTTKLTEGLGLPATRHQHPEVSHVTTATAGVALPKPATVLGGSVDRKGGMLILMDRAAAGLLRIALKAQERPYRPDVHGAQEGSDVFAHFLGPGSPVLRM